MKKILLPLLIIFFVISGFSLKSVMTIRSHTCVQTKAELYNYSLSDGQAISVYGESVTGDIPIKFYYWNASSTATDDGENVIQPTGIVTGRFIKIAENVPTGTINMFAGSSTTIGYLLCDGTAVSRTTYASLFGVIGTVYGSGNGSTTFNIPDLRQKFPLGKASSGTGSALGSTGGTIDHLHTVNPPSTNTSSDGSHNHTGVTGTPSATAQATALGPVVGSGTHTHTISSDGTHLHSLDIAQLNSGTENPPFIALNYIIKY